MGRVVTRVSFDTKALESGSDARSRNGNESRYVMNDSTKAEGDKRRPVGRAREGHAPQRLGRWDEEVPDGNGRVRRSEPYLTWIGQCLRQSYEETLKEPVPEQFHLLLDRLEQEEDGGKSSR